MKYKVRFGLSFHKDVVSMTDYLEDYPEKAERILSQLDRVASMLTNMPELYPVYDILPIFRKIAIEDYLVFYTVDKLHHIVSIYRLLYGGMDIPAQLK